MIVPCVQTFTHTLPHTLTPSPQAKKDVAQIFTNILRRQIGTRSPTVEYVCTKSEILFILIRG